MRNITLLLATCSIITGVHAQDQCTTAIAITAGSHTVVAVNGIGVPTPICAPNGAGATAGEWYSYTPTADYGLTITTDLPENAGKDTRFHLYTGICGSLMCVGGDDDSGAGNLSVGTYNVQQGIQYKIAFDNRWSSSGFTFQLIENDPVVSLVSFTPQPISVTGMAMAVVDMDNDHLDDVVSVNGPALRINHQQPDGTFIATNIATSNPDNQPYWSLAAGDIDGNGFLDLLYGGGNGVTFMKANNDGTAFSEVSGPEYVFTQRSNFVDINNDGQLDAFACHDVQPNCYYINDGNGNLTFHQGGLGDTPDGGNYGSLWSDFDNDGDVDMYISKCRGADSPSGINQLHRNNGDGTYTEIAASVGLADNTQTWSSAVGDFDNDGDMDILVGASSFFNGGHQLMRNDLGTFVNITEGSGYDTFTGTSIEHVTHDWNNDGWLDVMGGDNTIMINNGDMTFTPALVTPTSGAVGDLNNDGFLDILNGGTMYLNDGNENNWIKINTMGVESNKNGIGARVYVTTASLGTQIRDVRAGDGFRYMSSITAHFGLGPDTEVEQIMVHWPSGIVDVIENPGVNTTVNILEGLNSVGVAETPGATFGLFPNPAVDMLYFRSDRDLSNSPVTIFDATGKKVMTTTLRNDRVDVSALTTGVYLVRVTNGGQLMQERFTRR